MDTRTQPIPTITIDPESFVDRQDARPLDRRRNPFIRPAIITGLAAVALTLVVLNWAAVLTVLVVIGIGAVLLLVVAALLIRLALGTTGQTGAAILGGLLTAVFLRRR